MRKLRERRVHESLRRASSPVDLLITALADRHSLGVLHYDHDYDLIAEKTDLAFDSVWLAARVTL
jgi:hypothetical protein